MKEIKIHRNNSHSKLPHGDIDDIDIDQISNGIGMIIIEFNSLESAIESNINDLMTGHGDEFDEVYIFFDEMMYRGKSNVLMKLYAHTLHMCPEKIKFTEKDLKSIQKRLEKSGEIRNQYAHAKWENITENKYVCVKTQAKIEGVFEKYKLIDKKQMQFDYDYIVETQNILFEFEEKFNHYLSLPYVCLKAWD